jgi:hypothetical protein
MKTVWATFMVPDDAEPGQVAEVLELVFRAPPSTAAAQPTARRAMEVLRLSPPTGTSLEDHRLWAADCVHVSYDYGDDVLNQGRWTTDGDVVSRKVLIGQNAVDAIDAVLHVTFEHGTALVLGARAEGDALEGPGRRLDPLLVDSEDIARARLAAGERAMSGLEDDVSPTSPWYAYPEPGMVAIARDLLIEGASARLVVVFDPGSTTPASSRSESDETTNGTTR